MIVNGGYFWWMVCGRLGWRSRRHWLRWVREARQELVPQCWLSRVATLEFRMEDRGSALWLWLHGTTALEVGLKDKKSVPWRWVSSAVELGDCDVEIQGFNGVIVKGTESGLKDGVLTIGSDMEHQ